MFDVVGWACLLSLRYKFGSSLGVCYLVVVEVRSSEAVKCCVNENRDITGQLHQIISFRLMA